jgi:hypothetical protein
MMKKGKYFFIILFGFLSFPSLAIVQVNTSRLLLIGTFHGNEVVARSGEKWLAMVPSDKGFTLMETRVRIKFVKDELQDNENEATGKKVSAEINKKVLFFVRGIITIKPGEVETIAAISSPLEINNSIPLRLSNGRSYKLSLVCEETTPLTVDNFKECPLILITGSRAQSIMTFSVYYPPDEKPIFASDAHPSLLWAGDIDRDGAIDLLLDLTNHYNISNPTLFLSSAAQNDALVIKVAEFITYGD